MGIFSLLYYIGNRVDRAMQLARQKRLPVPVISIGNITTGGTGKTPAAVALALEAKKRGRIPAVLTRGYKGKLKGPVMVGSHMDPLDVGDEPLLMAHKLGDIPVIKGADRYQSGIHAFEKLSPAPDLFILDDGYQHLKLYRDVNILLVSALNPFDNMRLLPVGLLREPLSQIGRADVVVVTKSGGERDTELDVFIRARNRTAPIYYSDHRPMSVRSVSGDTHPLEWLDGRKVHCFCGIAEPESFRKAVEHAGAVVAGFTPYPDHYTYTLYDIDEIKSLSKKSGAQWIITTEKDIMRLRDMDLPENLVSLGIEFDVDPEFYDFVFMREEVS